MLSLSLLAYLYSTLLNCCVAGYTYNIMQEHAYAIVIDAGSTGTRLNAFNFKKSLLSRFSNTSLILTFQHFIGECICVINEELLFTYSWKL